MLYRGELNQSVYVEESAPSRATMTKNGLESSQHVRVQWRCDRKATVSASHSVPTACMCEEHSNGLQTVRTTQRTTTDVRQLQHHSTPSIRLAYTSSCFVGLQQAQLHTPVHNQSRWLSLHTQSDQRFLST